MKEDCAGSAVGWNNSSDEHRLPYTPPKPVEGRALHRTSALAPSPRANMEIRLKNLDRFLRLAPPDCRLICGLGVRPEGKEQLPNEARHADTRDQTHDTAGHDGARNERSLCQTLVELKWALLSRS